MMKPIRIFCKATYLFGLLIVLMFGSACNPKQSTSSQNDTTEIAPIKVDSATKYYVSRNNFAADATSMMLIVIESSAKMIKWTENPDIQTLATTIVKEQEIAKKELQVVANKQQINLPQTLTSEQQKQIKILASANEEDRNYLFAKLISQELKVAIDRYNQARELEQNGTLKAFAFAQIKTIEAQHQQAENVLKIMENIRSDKGDFPLKISKSNR